MDSKSTLSLLTIR